MKGRKAVVLGVMLLALAVLVLASGCGTAALQNKMGYQGRLTDAAGNPINGTKNMTFRLYTVETGGTAIWEETHTGVQVTEGLFNVVLGENTPLDEAQFHQPLYLEVVVDGETLSPRQQLLGAPYAFSLVPGAVIKGYIAATETYSSTLTVANLLAADGGQAIAATSSSGIAIGGIGGNDPEDYGGYFEGGRGLYARAKTNARADLVLGGNSDADDDGRITSDPTYSSSDIVLVSNDNVRIDLDNDGDGEDADFEIRDKDNNLVFDVDESGDVRQNLAGNGLVKAAVFAFCGDSGSTIHRYFNNVTGAAITISNGPGDGQCTIDFGFDISARYIVAVPHTTGGNVLDRGVTVRNATGTSAEIFRFRASTGDGRDGDIAVLVY